MWFLHVSHDVRVTVTRGDLVLRSCLESHALAQALSPVTLTRVQLPLAVPLYVLTFRDASQNTTQGLPRT